MKIDFVARDGYKIADRFEKVISEKLEKLNKYFDKEVDCKVVCKKYAKLDKLEITITTKGAMFRSEVASDNMYDNIDIALPKLEKQIVRTMDRKKDKKNESIKFMETTLPSFEFLQEEPEELPAIIKRKTFDLDPLLLDDAILAIERLGHDFFVFLNAETGKVNVLYKRKDDKLGLIDLNY